MASLLSVSQSGVVMLNNASWALSFLNNLLKSLYFTNLVTFIFNSA